MDCDIICAEALTCFRCTVPTTGYRYGSGAQNLFPGFTFGDTYRERDTCLSPDRYAATRETCPDDEDYVCGSMHVTIHKPGNIERSDSESSHYEMDTDYDEPRRSTADIIIKKCMPARIQQDETGCTNNNRTIRQMASQSLDVTEDYLRDMKVKGNLCYCKSSMCDPGCGDNAYIIQEICISKWWFHALAVGLLGTLVLSIAGCCCCCRARCCCMRGRCRKADTTTSNSGRNLAFGSSPTFVRRPVYVYKPLDNEKQTEGADNPALASNA